MVWEPVGYMYGIPVYEAEQEKGNLYKVNGESITGGEYNIIATDYGALLDYVAEQMSQKKGAVND